MLAMIFPLRKKRVVAFLSYLSYPKPAPALARPHALGDAHTTHFYPRRNFLISLVVLAQ
jgi:hypothetical protein